MEFLWAALGSSATICWFTAQLIAFVAGSKISTNSKDWPLQRSLSLAGSVLYVVALILLAQIGFLGDWPRFFAVLGLVILLTVSFGVLRYLRSQRSASTSKIEGKSDQNVLPQ